MTARLVCRPAADPEPDLGDLGRAHVLLERAPSDSEARRLDEIMQRYAADDAAAFGELYDAVAPRLRRFCLHLLRRRSEADDLFQDALLRLHRARASYTPRSPPLRWILAITRSAHLDRLRSRRCRPEDLGQLDDARNELGVLMSRESSPEAEACGRALLLVVEEELGRMSEKHRSAYRLLWEEGLSVSRAAAILGVSDDTLRQRAHRAGEQIRAALRGAGWDAPGAA